MTEPGSSDLSEEQRLDSPDVILAHIMEMRQSWPEPEEKDLYDPAGKVSALWGAMYRFGWSVSPPPELSTGSSFLRLWLGDSAEGREFRAEQWRQFHEALSIAEDESRKHQGKSLPQQATDCPGWGLICDLSNLSPEIEEACPGWAGLEFPNTLVELREYAATALESFRDITLWGGINQIEKGYFRIDTRRERMRNDLRIQYANAILRNANLWLHHQRISDNRRPIFSGQVETSIEADKRLDELTQWLIGVTGTAKPGSADGAAGTEAELVAQSVRVKLFGRADRPQVDGKKKGKLLKARYDVVLALLKAGAIGLTKDELDEKSKHGDARGILKRLAKSDSDWQAVISFPGQTGGGYRIS